MLHTLHLVRHAEVHNPDRVVYADLDGYHLSPTGLRQAAATGERLAGAQANAIVCSPLDRAVQTATPIAFAAGIGFVTDDRLTEWTLGTRWAGVRWDDIATQFPGEVEAYLTRPTDLDFTPETIAEVAARMESVVVGLSAEHSEGTAIIVSHQDPIQALRLILTGRSLSDLQIDKPTHGCVITLTAEPDGWTEATSWTPEAKSSSFPPMDPPIDTH